MAVADATQSEDLAYDLKVGSLVGAYPEAQIYGQVIGSLFGAFLSSAIYKLYAAQYAIPGPLFKVPSAYLILSTSRLLLGRGLPDGIWHFALGAAFLSILSSIVKMRYEIRWWQKLIPSGVSFAIGKTFSNMAWCHRLTVSRYIPFPSFSITRAFGGLFYMTYKYHKKGREGNVIILASGLVLGESVASLVNVAFTGLRGRDVGAK